MPELPEVESLRRSLVPYIVGQKIKSVKVLKPKLVSAKGTIRSESAEKVSEFEFELKGEKIVAIDRIAKNLILRMESGKLILIHLKMTGQLVYRASTTSKNSRIITGGHPIELSEIELPHKHSHVIFELEQGTLFFNDTRMFGYLLYYPSWSALESENHFTKLGVDPLGPDFSYEYFEKSMQKKTGRLKSVFMNQEVVVGLGNIYCDEVCFEAGVLPTRPVSTLKKSELKKLYQAIVRILNLAVELGGSSVANYLLADGSRGNYAREHKVYNRASKPCLICSNPLKKIIINSRTTVFCEVCQK
ncbi:MAG: bifunctional DNA-formamidopyrimidine glycosylase/DNA-(apurinic or apyrimidinic site) lyase [Patescibacteria group bacterium]